MNNHQVKMQLDNLQHLINLGTDPFEKNYALERPLWIYDAANDRYVEFFGRLRANLLFLFEANSKGGDYSISGVYILERFRIVDEPESDALIGSDDNNDRHQQTRLFRFSLLFIDSGESVRLATVSSLEKDEWLSCMSKASTSPGNN